MKNISINNTLEGAFVLSILLDWKQTLTIARSPNQWHEYNKILGKHPTVAEVNRYFIGVLIAQFAIWKLAPENVTNYLLAAGLTLESIVVARNYNIGIK